MNYEKRLLSQFDRSYTQLAGSLTTPRRPSTTAFYSASSEDTHTHRRLARLGLFSELLLSHSLLDALLYLLHRRLTRLHRLNSSQTLPFSPPLAFLLVHVYKALDPYANTFFFYDAIVMAILDSLPGVEVTVVVEGKDLHEYRDSGMEDEENTITKYVEAVTGANFAIKIMVPKKFEFEGTCLAFNVAVDGSKAQSPLIGPKQVRLASKIRLVEGVRVSHIHIRKFRFSSIETVNDHGFGLSKDLERAKNLGCIRVVVSHKNKKRLSKAEYKEPKGDDGFISEKAIKGQAITHTHSLDAERHVDKSSRWKTENIIGDQGPRGTFLFYYKSEDSLRKMLIIPRTPSPVPLRDRPIGELNNEEKAELIRQLMTENAEKDRTNKRIKRELGDGDDDNSRTRKRGRSSLEPAYLELNDDGGFTEIAMINKEKEKVTITLD